MLGHGQAYLVGVRLEWIHRRTRRMYGRKGLRQDCALSDSDWPVGYIVEQGHYKGGNPFGSRKARGNGYILAHTRYHGEYGEMVAGCKHEARGFVHVLGASRFSHAHGDLSPC